MRKFLRILWTTHSIECVAHSIECAPFYRMAGILGIPRMRNAFYRMRKFLECAEHIYSCYYPISKVCKYNCGNPKQVTVYWRVNKRISLISAHRLLSSYYVVGFNPTLLSACDF